MFTQVTMLNHLSYQGLHSPLLSDSKFLKKSKNKSCAIYSNPADLSQFWSFKIRHTTFPNNIKFADLLIAWL